MSLVVWGPSSEVGLSPMTHFGLTISLTNTNWRRKYSSPPPPPPLTEHSQNPEFHDVPECVRVDVPQVFWLCYSPKKKTHLVTCSFNMNDSQLLAFTAAIILPVILTSRWVQGDQRKQTLRCSLTPHSQRWSWGGYINASCPFTFILWHISSPLNRLRLYLNWASAAACILTYWWSEGGRRRRTHRCSPAPRS